MRQYRYILERYDGMNTRYRCPKCNKEKIFCLYIDTETKEKIHSSVGRCNRESNCGYHYTPKQYFQDNNIAFDSALILTNNKPLDFKLTAKEVSFIPVEIFKQSLQIDKNVLEISESNNFVKFLIELFGIDVTNQLVLRYFIATSKHWKGANVFWQVDYQGNIRTGKIMLYNSSTGKRIKQPLNYINWAHKALKKADFELKQCLFGEHLLIDNKKPVALVESEKTAIIASVYLPQFIWLAVGSLTNLNAEKCNILKGRSVTLFPDLNGFVKWSKKAKELSQIAIFNVSDLLERKANKQERELGFDLADYLIKFDFNDFILHESIQVQIEKTIIANPLIVVNSFEPNYPTCAFNESENSIFEGIEQEILELESYFKTITLPNHPIKINQCSTIINIPLFIECHLTALKLNKGKNLIFPYINRLKEFRNYLNNRLN